jgi:transcriptional regulator with XRE-family HTH domain
MSYQSEELVREVQSQRIKAALSQRALAARSGLTQAHISQIETGRLEPGLSSFVEMARALDLEVVLVPKKLLSAVQGVLRASADGLGSPLCSLRASASSPDKRNWRAVPSLSTALRSICIF